ncbi:hypothetical protein BO78DRAFT_46744 [Aspergillus sclerotiicarbonarius CBS 121057]|uniref:Uncharacterized protein n=1 Tax=Aspergillus sclerotiicarbonarius (strain CBS 121057 / IBT 28362) TaxID=1448318 RepID=A0A319EQN1_ASPSB|nr:hypothetical protein BO78DRAFT_46744 [Aspergillus sclerotiicarbonarius CBS 121057]
MAYEQRCDTRIFTYGDHSKRHVVRNGIYACCWNLLLLYFLFASDARMLLCYRCLYGEFLGSLPHCIWICRVGREHRY